MRADSNRHQRAAEHQRLSCVRCQRSNANGSESFLGRIRMIVGRQICISCWNREREVMKGSNSKDAMPVKWAHLRPATLTIEQDGKQKTISAGLRTRRAECERLVAQAHPGATLVECFIDGKAVQFGEDEPEVSVSRKALEGAKVRKVKPRPVASVADGDGDEFGYRVPTSTRKPNNAKPLPVASDAEAFSNDDDEPPMLGWRKPAWSPARVAEPEALPKVAEAVPDDSEQPEPAIESSEWTDVFVSSERGQGSVAQIARERGVSGDQVARELVILDEPAPASVKQPAPEPLTRKERRAYERTERRAAKKAARAARQATAPSIKQTARAYIGVLLQVGARK
ncbi:hypothetical protein [Paraburkholderia strydomiana]